MLLLSLFSLHSRLSLLNSHSSLLARWPRPLVRRFEILLSRPPSSGPSAVLCSDTARSKCFPRTEHFSFEWWYTPHFDKITIRIEFIQAEGSVDDSRRKLHSIQAVCRAGHLLQQNPSNRKRIEILSVSSQPGSIWQAHAHEKWTFFHLPIANPNQTGPFDFSFRRPYVGLTKYLNHHGEFHTITKIGYAEY